MSIALASLHIYPVKSCAPLALDQAVVQRRGLAHDRRWMVVDDNGKFITGRQLPRLTLLSAVPLIGDLQLNAPGMPSLRLPQPPADAARLACVVWDSQVAAQTASADADAWLSAFLDQPCRFVYMDANAIRPTQAEYSRSGDEVSFADGFPLLLLSQAALDQLNAKLATPLSMLRFRPNLVVAGADPHAEDAWRRIRIGAVEFDVVKPCIRCVFTTVDFERGVFDGSGEPLATLKTYRRTPNGIAFGQNLIPRGDGMLLVGDAIEVLA